ncbi:MAG TPA: efflux RND transporter periplasmic adaptor subunit [Rhizomicrobium sp.]|nr:efflux RND transporter periplasmic adaptor subunit [Rhizomicrobium sp.]
MIPPEERAITPLGRTFLWGGVGLGFLLVVLLFTKGFGLFAGGGGVEEAPLLIHRGDKIFVPEGSALRSRLTVMPARAVPVDPKMSLPAVVESNPALTAPVLTPLTGRVVRLGAQLGDRVQRGQVLAVIDSPDLAQADDDYQKAADAYALTQKTLARQQQQIKIGAIAIKDLDQAKSDNAQAEAEYARTKARLIALDAFSPNGVQSHLLNVRAPMSGGVTTLAVQPGNMINDPTQAIMTVADLGTIWVTAMVPEKDIAKVAKNDDAYVRLDAYPDRPLHGKVLFVSDVVEPDTRRNKIRIAFANPGYLLKPNMFATVIVASGGAPRVVVPASALLMNNDRTSVFVATAPWTFERRVVDPLLEEGPDVAIRSGLKPGESVVVRGGILLND